MQEGSTTRSSQFRVSAALAAANAALEPTPGSVRFPGEDGGRSLAEMAQRDLDAALQLLADRAQYITGANGAAIALRRYGKNDMQCRASSGSNVPELGALLSTEFGLSGESVRTRRALRCDDAERDARVNRDVCREMGIASVVVMPVVNDDEVLGVFELFSGRVNAFGDRDLSALQRLSEMVETAVRLAQASATLPEKLQKAEVSVSPALADDSAEEILEFQDEAAGTEKTAPVAPVAGAASVASNARAVPVAATSQVAAAVPATTGPKEEKPVAAQAASAPAVPPAPKKPLFWSAALSASAEAEKAGEDLSHVPPMLRNLKKCAACGFPVSSERTLCVECEEKKWRGQLRPTTPAKPEKNIGSAPSAPVAAPVARLMAAAAASSPAPTAPKAPAAEAKVEAKPVTNVAPAEPKEADPIAPAVAVESPKAMSPQSAPAAPEFVLSAAMEPSTSWFARNKFVVGAIILVAATVVAVLCLR